MKKISFILLSIVLVFSLISCEKDISDTSSENNTVSDLSETDNSSVESQIKNVVIYYGFSSYALFTDDTSVINELEDFYDTLETEKTDKKLDISTAFHVNLGEKSFWIDKEGVIWLDGNTENLVKKSGTMDYTRIEQIYKYEDSSTELPFPEPSFEIGDRDDNYIQYINVTKEGLSDYIDTLKSEGFECRESEYYYFLYRDNIIILMPNAPINNNYVYINYYEGIETTREDSLTPEQAKDIIGINYVHLIEYYVPDLFEQTGAQIFYAISKDTDNEAWQYKYLVTSKEAVELPMAYDDYLCADIDSDSHFELLNLVLGPTSGIYTFGINGYSFENNEIELKYSNVFVPVYYYYIKLISLDNKKAGFATKTQDTPAEYEIFDISIKDGEIVLIDSNGKEISSWDF